MFDWVGLAIDVRCCMTMRKIRYNLIAFLAVFFMAFAMRAMAAGQSAKDMRVSGPITSGNLSVFFIHGKDQIKGASYLTLEEALKQKKVVVHETGNVNELKIDNKSAAVV